jgi:plastocyanin
MKTSRSSQRLRWIAIVASMAAMALALVGFGNALASGGPTATASATKSVRIQGFVYHPGTLRIKAGTKVTFVNKDSGLHNAVGKGFSTATLHSGQSGSITFKKKGTFAYHCTIHPEMHGKVIVG